MSSKDIIGTKSDLSLKAILMVCMVMLFAGCTPDTKKSGIESDKTAISDERSAPDSGKSGLNVNKAKKPRLIRRELANKKTEKKAKQQNVLILLSSSVKSYQRLAQKIASDPGVVAVEITLSGDPAQDNAVVRDIQSSDTVQIVAIGLKAAQSVKSITNKQIVFAQVVNYRDYGLVGGNFKGVSALPSPEKLFKDWKALSPGLSKVAVVVGKNLHSYLRRAQKAAELEGIELIIEQVASDKEFVYRSKNMQRNIQGQWILPDNRVLSVKALKEVMAYGSRRGRQIVVFSPGLLSYGGLFYVSPDIAAIAEAVLLRLRQSAGKADVQGDGVLPVMSHILGINQNIARQFNLIIPAAYRKYINDR
ncbi:hypothetical protein MNBD_GAMMA11-3125 [hydrothermal vent metagenome]|uniref:Uncharacterized protein n=1 Tax=hydrothermal vent metagenome TaxID=652676 RepID=A0A3B0Y1V9_9ZZZZ